MEEIVKDFGEVRISLKEYNDMRDEIRQLHEDNNALVAERDHICDENKVRVRRMIIKIIEPSQNPNSAGTKKIIEDKMVNLEEVTNELDLKIYECEKGWKRKVDYLEKQLAQTKNSFEICQRMMSSAEKEVSRLKKRKWWELLFNI